MQADENLIRELDVNDPIEADVGMVGTAMYGGSGVDGVVRSHYPGGVIVEPLNSADTESGEWFCCAATEFRAFTRAYDNADEVPDFIVVDGRCFATFRVERGLIDGFSMTWRVGAKKRLEESAYSDAAGLIEIADDLNPAAARIELCRAAGQIQALYRRREQGTKKAEPITTEVSS